MQDPTIEAIVAAGPALLLIDETLSYITKASGLRVGRGFLSDQAQALSVAQAYWDYYRSHPGDFPQEAQAPGYRELMARAYPFQPALIEILRAAGAASAARSARAGCCACWLWSSATCTAARRPRR